LSGVRRKDKNLELGLELMMLNNLYLLMRVLLTAVQPIEGEPGLYVEPRHHARFSSTVDGGKHYLIITNIFVILIFLLGFLCFLHYV
jgi:hypothetical protein